jgi:hypothetical protein
MAKHKNKPTTYDGIRFRSGLEVVCYKLLKKHKIPFKYEKVKYTLTPTFKYEVPSYEIVTRNKKKVFTKQYDTVPKITYTPDFVGDNWIIETKGQRTATFNVKWKLFKKYLSEAGMQYHLFMPSNEAEILQSINMIKKINNHGSNKIDKRGSQDRQSSKRVRKRR